MGVLVTGSSISPRIFISTSIAAPQEIARSGDEIIGRFRITRSSDGPITRCDHLPNQTIRQRGRHSHWNITAWLEREIIARRKVQSLVLRRSADPLRTG